MTTKFKPLRDRIVIKRQPLEERVGLIWVPQTSQKPPQIGEIIAIGEGYVDERGGIIPLRVKVGQRILFGKYTGTDITLDGDELVIMREEDILGIVED